MIYDNRGFNKFVSVKRLVRSLPDASAIRYNLSVRTDGTARFSPHPCGRKKQTT